MKSLLAGLLTLAAALPARADLQLLEGSLGVGLYALESPLGRSAELLLQLPEQIDGWAPVPLHLRVLKAGVESIHLLTEGDESEELGRFELGAAVRPDLMARYRSGGESGIRVEARTAKRLLSMRRSYRTVTTLAAPESSSPPSDTAASAQLRLQAYRDSQGLTYVRLAGMPPLVESVQHPERLWQQTPRVDGFELLDGREQLLVRAELSEAMARQPYLRFVIEGLAEGDTLYLRWNNREGESGELSVAVGSVE